MSGVGWAYIGIIVAVCFQIVLMVDVIRTSRRATATWKRAEADWKRAARSWERVAEQYRQP